ncbi:MAG TPA: AMP-binding protein [Kaistiaceae bacterium]|nr:AMP-binding protein [Kaistiaceae bacterium]
MSVRITVPEDRVRSAGRFWPGITVIDRLDAVAAATPDKAAIVARNSTSGRTTTLTWRQLRRIVDRMALALVDLGIGKDDVVSCQLPNWWEFTALHLAAMRIGAVTNPIMPIFREREVGYMLGHADSRLVVVPKSYRGFDYPAMLEGLKPGLPKLEHVIVIGGEGEAAFETALLGKRREGDAERERLFAERRMGPDDVVQLLYTSGTTGEPKGVMHTSNTLFSNIVVYAERLGLSADDVVLMASPMAHQTGFMYGLMMPVYLGAKAVLQDVWDPAVAATLIEDEAVSFTMASTPFLADLAGTPALSACDISSLGIFLAAGAPIPSILAERAAEKLGAEIISAWGMTENGAVTTTKPGDPAEKAFGSDGVAVPGMEVRVRDDDDNTAPTGVEGRLEARGAGNFVGYFKRPELAKFTEDGWFDTGDLARMDADGYIRITGRAKDIIIRGGENVPVVEVEEILYRHPAVAAAAVVAMPDERLGERGCAFVTLKPEMTLTLDEVRRHLAAAGMSKQYWPERLEISEELPRTASGKIQKFRLREIAGDLKPE